MQGNRSSKYEILSVGIDIGTTTTHLVFSKIHIVNMAGGSAIPHFEIASREIIYQSDVYFTPLLSETEIDVEKLKEIIVTEYAKAEVQPSDVKSGAVIITGESAQKENADQVAKILEGLAGDFVVAVAGPDLEAILAGEGSGARELSRQKGIIIANLDIGGGTTNIAVFDSGELCDTATFKVGGRLFCIDPVTLTVRSVTSVARQYAEQLGLVIEMGRPLQKKVVEAFCQALVDTLDEVIERRNLSAISKIGLVSGPLRRGYKIDALTFSGGVGHYIYQSIPENPFVYGDYGPYLAKFIKENSCMIKRYHILRPRHTLRATVIGAGVYSMKLSGSTIFLKNYDLLPLRNVPVVLLPLEERENRNTIRQKLTDAIRPYKDKYPLVAVAISGWKQPTLKQLEELSFALAVSREVGNPLVVITEGNYAKVLGYLLEQQFIKGEDLICLDEIKLSGGDFIDIGSPLPIGRVVPVVIKRLVFSE
ncbi:MAG: ethanolamine ammonia-lyase reactivating factor EutA [Thermacetogeniaceae bacterium]